MEVARLLKEAGFSIMATGHTRSHLEENGIEASRVYKMTEGRPNIYDMITNGKVQLVVNTPKGTDDDGADESVCSWNCDRDKANQQGSNFSSGAAQPYLIFYRKVFPII